MKSQFIFILASLALTVSVPVYEIHERRVDPSEDNPNRLQSFLWEDERGIVHNESLTGAVTCKDYDLSHIRLYLYTRDNPNEPEQINLFDLSTLGKSKVFKTRRENVFVIHGWKNDRTSAVNTLIREAMLARKDVNHFVVDWGEVSNRNYLTARYSVPSIGATFGFFLSDFMHEFRIASERIMLIGHSLGAHVAGAVGAAMHMKPAKIIGLDPAGPLFSLSNTAGRLDDSDAQYVQVIHTSGGKLAFKSSLGHADYFPNGGDGRQPGCGMDIFGMCAHSRSYQYYAESIKSCQFQAIECTSFTDFEEGHCKGNDVSRMGCIHTDMSATGDFYLKTNSEEPFAQTLRP